MIELERKNGRYNDRAIARKGGGERVKMRDRKREREVG